MQSGSRGSWAPVFSRRLFACRRITSPLARDSIRGLEMTTDRSDAGGTVLGLQGLRSAIDRLHLANEQILSGGGATPSAIALGEARISVTPRRAQRAAGRQVGELSPAA